MTAPSDYGVPRPLPVGPLVGIEQLYAERNSWVRHQYRPNTDSQPTPATQLGAEMITAHVEEEIAVRLIDADNRVDDVIEYGTRASRWTAVDVGRVIKARGFYVDDRGHANDTQPKRLLIEAGLDHAVPAVRRQAEKSAGALEKLRKMLDAERESDQIRSRLAAVEAEREQLRSKLRHANPAGQSKTVKVIQHGTRRGWFQHRNRKEWPPCQPCSAAYELSKTATVRSPS